jgi:hypothetical protein
VSSGSYFFPPNFPFDDALSARGGWAGTNGKYEVINGFRRLKFNAYTGAKWHQRAYQGETMFSQFPNGKAKTGANFIGLPFLNPEAGYVPLSSAEEMKLQSRLVSKIKGHDFNLAVNLAQSGQTVSLVLDNLRKLGKSMRALRHGDFSTAARQLGAKPKTSKLKSKDISGRWLELQYGWLPTLGDTFEAVKAYESITNYRGTTFKATLKTSGDYEASGSPGLYKFPGRYKTTVRLIAELSEIPSPLRGLGLADPLSVVWEVIPYSFVVDWFLPIGTFFENLAIIPSLHGRFCRTTYWNNTAKFDNSAVGMPYSFMTGSRVYQEFGLLREPLSELTTQRPSFVAPGLALSGRRILNSIALTRQLFK